jgi:hypothetical protein
MNDYIDLPAEHAEGTVATLALWTMLTYLYPAWPAVPYLYVGGPLGSSKTRVFEIPQQLVYRPLSSSNLTAALLFRTLHERGGTLLLDEAERLRENTPDTSDVKSILLAGYKSGGRATRLEDVGGEFRPVEFEVYGPKALASINGLPPTLASRCINITMFRAAPGSAKTRRRLQADAKRWANLRDDLHTLALGELGQNALSLAQREDVCSLSGRDYELWQPIMALAAFIEDAGAVGLLSLVRAHAHRSIEDGQEDQTPDADEVLLRVVADEHRFGTVLTPNVVLLAAREREPDLFNKWMPRTVSNHLKRYGIVARKSGNRREYREVTIGRLLRIQTNYHIDLGLTDSETNGDTENAEASAPSASSESSSPEEVHYSPRMNGTPRRRLYPEVASNTAREKR